ncbi:MAG TPA: hypothetical protein VES20_08060 [Bryobacteraceae bacterium]|nr:hypothetical protein [Bryobacteraceae bacterium]
MVPRRTRRWLLGALASGAVASELKRFRDPATEFELLRLTDPAVSNSWIPRSHLRSVAGRGNSLFYLSDRSGSIQAWRMQIATGESVRLTSAQNLHPEMASATFDDRSLIYFDDTELVLSNGKRLRTLYTVPQPWRPQPPFAVSPAGQHAAFAETDGERYRLRLLSLRGGAASTLHESTVPLAGAAFRPRTGALLYRTPEAVTVTGLDGRNATRLKLPAGAPGDAVWSADGAAVHYLLRTEAGRPVQLRDHLLESGEDRLIGLTTHFHSVARNRDSSVFAGVSSSVAAPYLLLMIRAARRELAIAEHKATAPSRAIVVFSPDSQRVFYHTDREGKSAIYTIALERFVEKTQEEEAEGR